MKFAAASRRRNGSATSRPSKIHGHADAVGNETRNADLSQRRADAVKAFLVACGFDPRFSSRWGWARRRRRRPGKPAPEQSDRRVAFKVVVRPAPEAP